MISYLGHYQNEFRYDLLGFRLFLIMYFPLKPVVVFLIIVNEFSI
ncbi:hypothetical protein OE09_1343 [Flavobacteriaceae bacterium MAR_2010_72]|nr:hypothetical protein OE09_1343 [Flavobacteriaceae bacterium MAR_2010_72]